MTTTSAPGTRLLAKTFSPENDATPGAFALQCNLAAANGMPRDRIPTTLHRQKSRSPLSRPAHTASPQRTTVASSISRCVRRSDDTRMTFGIRLRPAQFPPN